MKFRITKAEHDALTPEMKLLYVADGDGFKLPLTDYQDPAPLSAALDRERVSNTERQTKITTLTEELALLKRSTPQDIRTLQSAHETKLTEQKTEYETRLSSVRQQLESQLLDTATSQLAGDLTGTTENARVISPHIAARLAVEWDGDKAIIKIKNTDGSLGSALNPDSGKELKKTFVDNPVFAAIVVKTRASGGGAAGVSTGTPGSAGGAGKKLSEMKDVERIALHNSDPAEFKRLTEADAAERRNKVTVPIKPLFQK